MEKITYKIRQLHPFVSQNHEPPGDTAPRITDPTTMVGKTIRSVLCFTGRSRGSGPWVELFFTDHTSAVLQGQLVFPEIVPAAVPFPVGSLAK